MTGDVGADGRTSVGDVGHNARGEQLCHSSTRAEDGVVPLRWCGRHDHSRRRERHSKRIVAVGVVHTIRRCRIALDVIEDGGDIGTHEGIAAVRSAAKSVQELVENASQTCSLKEPSVLSLHREVLQEHNHARRQ